MYGIDLDDRRLLRRRSWRWLKVRIEGLMYDPNTRLFRGLNLPVEGGSDGAEGR